MIAWIKQRIDNHKADREAAKTRYERLKAEARDAGSKMGSATVVVDFGNGWTHLVPIKVYGRGINWGDGDFIIRHAEDLLRQKFVELSQDFSQKGVTVEDFHYPAHTIRSINLENVVIEPKHASVK